LHFGLPARGGSDYGFLLTTGYPPLKPKYFPPSPSVLSSHAASISPALSLFSLISRTQLRLHLSHFSDSLSHASLSQTPSVLSRVTPPSPSASFCAAPAHSSSTGAPITRFVSLIISLPLCLSFSLCLSLDSKS
jgi:hypothetical protein